MKFLPVKTQYDDEFLLLLNFLKKILVNLKTDYESEEIAPKHFASGLGVKIFYHLTTIFHLSRGTNLTEVEDKIGFIDHSSIRIIIRAAMDLRVA